MKFILGLDPGTGYIGWAIILEAENEDERSRTIASGVVDVNFDNFAYINKKGVVSTQGNPVELFKKGCAMSPNLQRRVSRGACRNLWHYKQRRSDLKQLLRENGFINEDTILYEEGKNSTFETWELRSRAVCEEISLEELAKVLLMINKKRGYKSGKKCKIETDSKEKSEYLAAIIGRSKVLVEKHQTVGQYLMDMLAEHPLKGIKHQTFYRQDYEDEFERIWKNQIQYHPELTRHLKKLIKAQTIFFQRPIESKKYAVGFCEFESRQTEVEKGGKTQTVTTGSRVCPKSSPLFQEFRIWQCLNNVTVTNLKTLEKRPLSQDEKERLALELSVKKALKKGDILKYLFDDDTKNYDLNFKELVGNHTQAKLVEAYLDIVELTGHKKYDAKKTDAPKIYEVINDVFGTLNFKTDAINGQIKEDEDIYKQSFYRLWHLIYSFPGDKSRTGNDRLVKRIKDFFNFDSDKYAKKIAEIKFADGYGNLSAKAIQKILPKMKEGHLYSEACELVGYKHSARSRTNQENNARVLNKYLNFIPHNSLRNPFVEKVLNQIVLLVNNLIDEYCPLTDDCGTLHDAFDEIRIELARELRNGAQARENMTQAIEANTKEKDKCRKELIEKLNEELNEKFKKNNEEGYKVSYVSDNDVLKYRLYKELEKNGYKTLYSDSPVNLVDLILNKVFDKEHIIPKSKCPSNAFSALTIERVDVNNAEKGNLTAMDYIKNRYGEIEAQSYISNINRLYEEGAFSKTKRDNLLMKASEIPNKPLNRELGLTQYISRKAIEMLEGITKKVTCTTGSVTKRLREDWGLVNVLQELVWDKYQRLNLIEELTDKNGRTVYKIRQDAWTKRCDHRNHAMDAITIAFTKPAFIQYLNSLNAQDEERAKRFRFKYMYKEKGNWRFNAPMPLDELRQDVKRQLENILVFHQPSNKVMTPTKNKRNGKVQLTPRGKLHDDTYYGRIINQENTTVYTHRVAIDKYLIHDKKTDNTKEKVLKRIDNIIHGGVKRIIKERFEAFSFDAKAAFSNLKENPIWFNEEKGICIKSVVIKATNVKDPIPLHKKRDRNGKVREGNEPVDFVKPNNNHHAAIYMTSTGELKERVVTFYEAVRRANNNQPVIDKDFRADEGWTFLCSIQRNDYWVFPDAESGFNPLEIDLMAQENYTQISPHLYKVQTLSPGDYQFRLHTDTASTPKKNLKDTTWKRVRNLNGLVGAVKVKLNNIGKITGEERIEICL